VIHPPSTFQFLSEGFDILTIVFKVGILRDTILEAIENFFKDRTVLIITINFKLRIVLIAEIKTDTSILILVKTLILRIEVLIVGIPLGIVQNKPINIEGVFDATREVGRSPNRKPSILGIGLAKNLCIKGGGREISPKDLTSELLGFKAQKLKLVPVILKEVFVVFPNPLDSI
jgi:hypothetical protein